MRLFLFGEVRGLELHLPCGFHEGRFVEASERSPGHTLNAIHADFTREVGHSTLEEIQTAIKRGAVVCTKHRGFYSRNSHVAMRSKLLIAFTWGSGSVPTSPGTRDTWRKCTKGKRIHVPLAPLARGRVREIRSNPESGARISAVDLVFQSVMHREEINERLDSLKKQQDETLESMKKKLENMLEQQDKMIEILRQAVRRSAGDEVPLPPAKRARSDGQCESAEGR